MVENIFIILNTLKIKMLGKATDGMCRELNNQPVKHILF